ncbi:hypothetical protein STK_00040 [Sulfurisphaera tokodaii str. 7]|uniref:C2H2-type domain-containing protein n=1 Tax=Sulfurisphaera tokodaii (strain DSM 16993 / JCM 10545 / NBRC 100140 / 7) TaxID=273063 RepID=F9VMH4_SULTO|nr:hypothetical protein [Sulfurisphaera tokodaii]BAK54120.1 hypothetical protein STK_00040 [Sulfurisphaera tokodaii str. 7]
MEYKCFICKNIFDSFRNLKIHVIRAHNNGQCPLCGKETKNLSMHSKMMAKSDPWHLVLSCILTECDYINDDEIKRMMINLVKIVLVESVPLDIISKEEN